MQIKRMLFGVICLSVVIAIGIKYGRSFSAHQEHKYTQAITSAHSPLIPLAIIGGGPAGYSAGLYGARQKVHTVVFEGARPGGQLMETSYVDNWPGNPHTLGKDIMDKVRAQAVLFGAVMVPLTIKSINTRTWPFELETHEGDKLYALSVVIATGATPKLLDVPGVKTYWGRGITTCAICDAPFYKDKDVIVVGGGDAAVEEAFQLVGYAKSITICVRGSAVRPSAASFVERFNKEYSSIHMLYNTNIKQILGDDAHVQKVVLETNGVKDVRDIDGVFFAIGHKPNTDWIAPDMLKLHKDGFIDIDSHSQSWGSQSTSVHGVFAAGDVADNRYRQAGVASGDGIKAVLDALSFLREISFESTGKETFFVPKSRVLGELLPVTSHEVLSQKLKARDSGIVIVEFYTDACPTCVRMVKVVQQTLGEFKDQAIGLKVHAIKSADISRTYAIAKAPTVLIFKNGSEMARITDLMSQQDFNALIKGLL